MQNVLLSVFVLFSGLFQPPAPAASREGATRLIDNERVSVSDVTWSRERPAPARQLQYDVVGVQLAHANFRTADTAGRWRETTAKVGEVFYLRKGMVGAEESTSDKPRRVIMVDLKDARAPALENKTRYPNAFPRPGVKKVLENNRIIVWDYAWTPGKPTPMHFHDKDVVVVYLENGELKSTTPDGKADVNPISFGLTRFNRRDRTHSEELVKGAARAIIVELK